MHCCNGDCAICRETDRAQVTISEVLRETVIALIFLTAAILLWWLQEWSHKHLHHESSLIVKITILILECTLIVRLASEFLDALTLLALSVRRTHDAVVGCRSTPRRRRHVSKSRPAEQPFQLVEISQPRGRGLPMRDNPIKYRDVG